MIRPDGIDFLDIVAEGRDLVNEELKELVWR